MAGSIKSIVVLCLMSLVSISTYAQTKLVVIPLGDAKDPNLVPENICHGITISGITGTTNCTPTVTSANGRRWMDRNLGASRAATAVDDVQAYGDLYQWGRGADGHQLRTSPTTDVLSSSDSPGHDSFITTLAPPYDWQSPQNHNLWQGVDGINNPCPNGFRLPTEAEWTSEKASWTPEGSEGAFSSPLKLVLSGYRPHDGRVKYPGTRAAYWSSTTDPTQSIYLYFEDGFMELYPDRRGDGYSVRCILDE